MDALGWALEARGHSVVRCADDANIYLRSERAVQRVMASVGDVIERRLRLKVNTNKSALGRPDERHFPGLQFAARAVRRKRAGGPVEADESAHIRRRLRALEKSLREQRGLVTLTQRYGAHPAREGAFGPAQDELAWRWSRSSDQLRG